MSIMWLSLSYVPKLNEELADNVCCPSLVLCLVLQSGPEESLGAKLGVIRSLPFGICAVRSHEVHHRLTETDDKAPREQKRTCPNGLIDSEGSTSSPITIDLLRLFSDLQRSPASRKP